MRLDRLTNKFQLALADAQSLALGHDNQFIEPLHLMSALLKQEGGSVSPLLTSAGVDVRHFALRLSRLLIACHKLKAAKAMYNPHLTSSGY